MRRRKGKAWSLDDMAVPAQWTFCLSVPERSYNFWAAQTQQSGLGVLVLLSTLCPVVLLMSLLHMLAGTFDLDRHTVLVSLPIHVIFGFVWWKKRMLQRILHGWPVVVGSIVQIAAHTFFMSASVICALQMKTELMQHRIFLCNYAACLCWCSSMLFVPFPVYLSVICPIYLSGWYAFHRSVTFLNPPCIVFGPLTIAVTAYVRHLQNQTLEHAFDSREALLKERQLLQTMQESLQGILSSIFDASCTCNRNGVLLQCSPHLQEVLDCPPKAGTSEDEGPRIGLNLCSFAATEGECQRLQAFLKNAVRSARQQAAKIECCFHRRSGGLIEACLYAIVLRAAAPSGDEEDVLFIALQMQSPDLDASTLIAEQNVRTSDDPVGDAPSDLINVNASVENSSLAVDPSSLHQLQQSRVVSKGCKTLSESNCLDEAVSLASLDWPVSVATLQGTTGSLSLSASVPSSTCAVEISPQQRICSVGIAEVQTGFLGTADAEVQTIGSAARPPLPSRVPNARRERSHRSSRTRHVLYEQFKATPRDVIQQSVLMSALSINPICLPLCCPQHTLLRYLRHEFTNMLKTLPCIVVPMHEENIVQCTECLSLQGFADDDTDFQCDFCSGTQFYSQNGYDESPTTTGMAADSEPGST